MAGFGGSIGGPSTRPKSDPKGLGGGSWGTSASSGTRTRSDVDQAKYEEQVERNRAANAERQRQQQAQAQMTQQQGQAPGASQAVAPVFGGAPAGGIAAAAAAPGASTMGGGVMGGGIQSNVAPDPNIANWEQERRDRLEGLKTPTDTSRLEGMAATGIAGAAAGQQSQAEEALAARGMGTGAGEAGGQIMRGISEGAQSDQARAQAEIQMNAENQRQQNISNTLGLGSQFAGQQGAFGQAGRGLDIAGYGAQTGRYGAQTGRYGAETGRQLGQGQLALGAYGAETQRGLGQAGLANEQERLRQQQMGQWAAMMGQFS